MVHHRDQFFDLFMLFINDISNFTTDDCSLNLFADDSISYVAAHNISDIQMKLQKCVDIISQYTIFSLDNLSKENHRSVNLLIMYSKLFERLKAEQFTSYLESILNPLVSAYRKGYNCQHVILHLTEYWRKALHDNKYISTIDMEPLIACPMDFS